MTLFSNPLLTDIILLMGGFVYEFIVIGLAMFLKKKGLVSGYTSRKIVHVFAGFAIFIIPYMTMPYLALVIPGCLWIMTYFSTPKARSSLREVFETMAQKHDGTTGHLWGPLAYISVVGLLMAVFTLTDPIIAFFTGTYSRIFQGRFYYAATALVVMMIADTFGSIIGRKYGKHKYSFSWIGTTRSIEGSVALLLSSFVLSFIAFLLLGTYWGFPAQSTIISGAILTFEAVIILSIVAALTGTLVEALSFTDIDDLTIPISITLVTVLTAIFFGFWIN